MHINTQKNGACRERCSFCTHRFVLFIPHHRKVLNLGIVLSKSTYTFSSPKNELNSTLHVAFYVVFRLPS